MPRLKTLTIILAAAAALTLSACMGDDDSGGGSSTDGNDDLFTSSGFTDALNAVSDEEGADAPLFDIRITSAGAEFTFVDGEQLTGQIYTGGELESRDVDVIGPGTLEGSDFPLSEVDPAAIDRIVEGVRTESGIDDVEVTVLQLTKQNVNGELQWIINAEGDGRTGLVFNADPDGSNVTSPLGDIGAGDTGSGAETPPTESGGGVSPDDAQAIAECVQEAAGDVAAIQACTE